MITNRIDGEIDRGPGEDPHQDHVMKDQLLNRNHIMTMKDQNPSEDPRRDPVMTMKDQSPNVDPLREPVMNVDEVVRIHQPVDIVLRRKAEKLHHLLPVSPS